MSVFKRPGAEIYSYDFRHRNRRFSGATGCTTKRDAERWEANEKARLKAAEVDASKPLTWEAAASLYWHEKGQHHVDSVNTERHLAWLGREIGGKTLVSEIDGRTIARLVAKRRGEKVAPATVNRSVTEALRKVLRRCERVWGAKVPKIEWSEHLLKEPQERVREASMDEQAAILAAIPEDYRPPLLFALLTGCRRIEIVGLTWQRVDFFNREFRVIGKRGLARTLPMTQTAYDLLWDLRHNHPESVFTYRAKRVRAGRVREERYPITASGFQTAWRRHAKPAVKDFRFHDARHTAATRLVRATGNIKLAQRLLGHISPTTTARYAHVTHDDLKAGLENVERAASPTQSATQKRRSARKALK